VKNQLLACLSLFLLATTACQNKTEPKNNKALAIPQLHCAVEYPATWSLAVSGRDSNQFTFLEPIQDSSDKFSTRISLWNEKMPFKLSAQDYNQGVITLIKLSNPQLHIDPLPADSSNGNKFLGYIFGFSNQDSSRFNVYGYTLLRDSFAFNITMTCEAGKESQYQDTLKQFLHNFTYRP
jgi:hypothetical protein